MKFSTRIKNGKKQYYWRYTSPIDGKEHRLSSYIKKDLEKRVKDKQKELALGITYSHQTFGKYLEWHLENVHLVGLRPSSCERYRYDIQRILEDPIANIPIDKLTDQTIQNFYNRYFKEKNSANQVYSLHKIIRPAIRYAAIRGDIKTDFMPLVRLPKDNAEKKMNSRKKRAEKPLTLEDEKRLTQYLIANAGSPFHENSLLFLFQLRLGLRIGECLALTWDDIRLIDGAEYVDISKTFKFTKVKLKDGTTQTIPVTGEPKSNMGYRMLMLPGELIPLIKQHKANQRKTLAKIGIMQTKASLVFGTKTGNHKHLKSINLSLSRICKRIGIPRHTSHDLRHTFGTRCFEAGLEPKTIQTLLGDSSLSMMMNTYIHVSNRMQAKKMKQLNDYYKKLQKEENENVVPNLVPMKKE